VLCWERVLPPGIVPKSRRTLEMSRVRRVSLIALASILILAAGLLWALPEIVRRVALDQIPRRTGRAVTIGDVDLNLFAGRLAVKDFRLADREGPAPVVQFERFEVRLSPLALLRSHVHVTEIALTGPSVRVVRTGPAAFNFSDLLGRGEPAAAPPAPPRRWAVTVERLSVAGGRVEVADRAVTPQADWLVQNLGIEVSNVTTRSMGAPGRLTLRARVDEAMLSLDGEGVRLDPLQFRAQLGVGEFHLRRLIPYVHEPLGLRHRPTGGRLGVALTAEVDSDAQEIRKATVAGTIGLDGEALVPTGSTAHFLAASRLTFEVKEADVIARTLTVASVAIEGADLKLCRDARGVIDVAEFFGRARRAARPDGHGGARAASVPEAGARDPRPADLVSDHPGARGRLRPDSHRAGDRVSQPRALGRRANQADDAARARQLPGAPRRVHVAVEGAGDPRAVDRHAGGRAPGDQGADARVPLRRRADRRPAGRARRAVPGLPSDPGAFVGPLQRGQQEPHRGAERRAGGAVEGQQLGAGRRDPRARR